MHHAHPHCSSQGEEGVVELELLKSDSYDDVSKALAGRLGLDHPLKLRLTGGRRGNWVCVERGWLCTQWV